MIFKVFVHILKKYKLLYNLSQLYKISLIEINLTNKKEISIL